MTSNGIKMIIQLYLDAIMGMYLKSEDLNQVKLTTRIHIFGKIQILKRGESKSWSFKCKKIRKKMRQKKRKKEE
jgi:hypothetical protein